MRLINILELAVIKCLKNKNGVCITEITKQTDIGNKTVRKILVKLINEKKVIVGKGKTNNGYKTKLFYDNLSNIL